MAYQPPLNGGRINASMAGNMANAATLISTGTLVLAGGNNVTLSQNGGSISIAAAGGAAVSGSNGSYTFQTLRLSNANGISFGTSAGSAITASHNGLTSQSNQALSGSNGSFAFQTATFGNLNGMSFYTSNGSMVGSYTVPTQTVQTQNMVSVQGSTGNVSFANANGITFGGNASTLTASHNGLTTQTHQNLSLSAVGNTTQTSTGTMNATNIYLSGAGNVSIGYSNGSAIISGGGGGIALANSQTTYATGTAQLLAGGGAITIASTTGQKFNFSVPNSSSLSATGALSISQNGNTLSIGVPAFSGGMSNIGNTTGTSGMLTNRIVFAGGSNILLSQSNDVNGATISIAQSSGGGGGIALANSQTTYATGTAQLLAGGGAITIASTTGQKFNFSVPATSSLSATGIVNITPNGNTLSIGAPAYSVALGTSTFGGATGGTAGTASNQIVLAAGSNITLSQSTGAGGNTVAIYGPAGGGGGGIAVANSQTTFTSGTANFVAGSGAITINSTTGQQLRFNVPSTSSIIGTNGISISTAGNTISIDGAGLAAGGTLSNWEPMPIQYGSVSNTQKGNGTVFFYKLQPQAFVSASRLLQLASLTMTSSSNNSHAGAISLAAGIYTANGSTLSMITQSSGSTVYQWSNTSNASFSLLTGLQGLTLPMDVNMTPGNYWLGMWSRTSSSGNNWFIASNVVFTNNNSSYQGLLMQASASSEGLQEGVGYIGTSSSALPTSAAMSIIRQSLFRSNAIPYINFKNMTY